MMIKPIVLAATALIMGAGTLAPSVADAQRGYYGGDGYYGRDYRSRDWDRRGYGDRGYYDRGYYGQRGYRGDYRRCRGGGTTGTILGAIAGGLLGRTVDTRGDRTVGTVIGGAAGALAGNAIEKGGRRGC